MRQVFVKELSYFTVEGLALTLGINEERAAACIDVLTTRGVLKLKTNNEANEYDIVEASDAKGAYQFVYVGLAIFEDVVIIVYPKYMKDTPSPEKIRQVFRVIRKSSGSFSTIAALSEDGIRSNDRLVLMLALLEMYGDYGIYSNFQKEYVANGRGLISWNRTMERCDPFFNDNIPVYFDFETIETTQDRADFITRLHKSVLTTISDFLEQSGLLELLDLDVIDLSDDDLEDLGDSEFLDYKLDQELSIQFVTWKQQLIQLLKRFVNDGEVLVQADDVICLGTSSFYHLWEEGCKAAFDDMLDKPLNKLGLHLNAYWKERSHESLLSIIPRPVWHRWIGGRFAQAGTAATLVPDIITFWIEENDRTFAIVDAKYYAPSLIGNPERVPGVESIAKQHLYQAAYKKFVLDNGFTQVINAFVVPTDGDVPALMGKVEFPGVFEDEPEPFSNDVVMWAFPAHHIWDCYLTGHSISEQCM